MAALNLTDDLRAEYKNLFDNCRINSNRIAVVDRIVTTAVANQLRYESVGNGLGIPWYFIAAVHNMESSQNFSQHLHNGDPLTARTVHVPPGRPATGAPPFTWEQSATDALTLEGLDGVTDWSLTGLLYRLEAYNGFGYRRRSLPTPYLWSFTNNYVKGKFVEDGKFDPDAVSDQAGAAAILRRMVDKGIITIDDTAEEEPVPDAAAIAALAADITFSNSERSDAAKKLQLALNRIPGISLKPDGIPGNKTSEAVKSVTGDFLRGDPRR